MKSIPLVFAFMSCKTKVAYIKLLYKLLLPFGNLRLSQMCLDFEHALWGAFV